MDPMKNSRPLEKIRFAILVFWMTTSILGAAEKTDGYDNVPVDALKACVSDLTNLAKKGMPWNPGCVRGKDSLPSKRFISGKRSVQGAWEVCIEYGGRGHYTTCHKVKMMSGHWVATKQ
jgi:hypothetical protein